MACPRVFFNFCGNDRNDIDFFYDICHNANCFAVFTAVSTSMASCILPMVAERCPIPEGGKKFKTGQKQFGLNTSFCPPVRAIHPPPPLWGLWKPWLPLVCQHDVDALRRGDEDLGRIFPLFLRWVVVVSPDLTSTRQLRPTLWWPFRGKANLFG